MCGALECYRFRDGTFFRRGGGGDGMGPLPSSMRDASEVSGGDEAGEGIGLDYPGKDKRAVTCDQARWLGLY